MENEWHDISKINDFREYYEFSNYVVVIEEDEKDDDGDLNYYTDIAFGINGFPKLVKRFYCIPKDDNAIV